MRVLITGAAGFIGSHLFRRLAAENEQVLGLVRANPSPVSERRIAHLEGLKSDHAKCLHIADAAAQDAAIRAFRPTACVHLAGRSAVRESFEKPGLYADANVRGTIALLQSLEATECRRVVHASTVMVYGADASFPCRENELGSGPRSFYGASKLAAETVLNTWRQFKCFESINLRLFSVFGPDQRHDSVPHLLVRAILDRTPFKVFGDGSSKRDYVDVSDILTGITSALKCPFSKAFPYAINLGSGTATALRDLVATLEKCLGDELKKEFLPTVQGETPAIVADIALAQRVLGFVPNCALRESMVEMVEWYLVKG